MIRVFFTPSPPNISVTIYLYKRSANQHSLRGIFTTQFQVYYTKCSLMNANQVIYYRIFDYLFIYKISPSGKFELLNYHRNCFQNCLHISTYNIKSFRFDVMYIFDTIEDFCNSSHISKSIFIRYYRSARSCHVV